MSTADWFVVVLIAGLCWTIYLAVSKSNEVEALKLEILHRTAIGERLASMQEQIAKLATIPVMYPPEAIYDESLAKHKTPPIRTRTFSEFRRKAEQVTADEAPNWRPDAS